MKQDHTCQYAAAVNEYIPDARSPVGNEHLDGLIDAGNTCTQQKSRRPAFVHHLEAPAQQHAQRRKFREVGKFAQKAAGIGILRTLGKNCLQDPFDPVAEGAGYLTGQQGISPDEHQIADQQHSA